MYKIGLCGYGYRAHFYLKIAKMTKEFEIVGIYTNSQEERKQILLDGYEALNDIREFVDLKPLFIISAVNKNEAYELSSRLLENNFYVLQETPYATNLEDIRKIRDDSHLQIAEQYQFFPTISAYKKIIDMNILGEVNEIHLSLMHDYHAYSVLRYLLNTTSKAKISGFKYIDKVTRTRTRKEEYYDGLIIDSMRKNIFIHYEDGKKAVYDFNSEEYRSPIRNRYIHILGTRGELLGNKIFYLDKGNYAKEEEIHFEKLNGQISKIGIKQQILFRDTNILGFNEDEYAIYIYLLKMVDFVLKGVEVYPNTYAKVDSIASIIMNDVTNIG